MDKFVAIDYVRDPYHSRVNVMVVPVRPQLSELEEAVIRIVPAEMDEVHVSEPSLSWTPPAQIGLLQQQQQQQEDNKQQQHKNQTYQQQDQQQQNAAETERQQQQQQQNARTRQKQQQNEQDAQTHQDQKHQEGTRGWTIDRASSLGHRSSVRRISRDYGRRVLKVLTQRNQRGRLLRLREQLLRQGLA
jgi:hypothetical protein